MRRFGKGIEKFKKRPWKRISWLGAEHLQMHYHSRVCAQRGENLLGNPSELSGLRITDCQNTFMSNGSGFQIQRCIQIALVL